MNRYTGLISLITATILLAVAGAHYVTWIHHCGCTTTATTTIPSTTSTSVSSTTTITGSNTNSGSQGKSEFSVSSTSGGIPDFIGECMFNKQFNGPISVYYWNQSSQSKWIINCNTGTQVNLMVGIN